MWSRAHSHSHDGISRCLSVKPVKRWTRSLALSLVSPTGHRHRVPFALRFTTRIVSTDSTGVKRSSQNYTASLFLNYLLSSGPTKFSWKTKGWNMADKIYYPNSELARKAHCGSMEQYKRMHERYKYGWKRSHCIISYYLLHLRMRMKEALHMHVRIYQCACICTYMYVPATER